MKFLTIFAIVFLAYNVVAYDADMKYANEASQTTKPFAPFQFAQLFEYVFDAFVEFLPQPFVNFMQYFYEAFQRFADFFPTEVKDAFYNVFHAMPFHQFYTPEFHAAVVQFYHAIKNFFTSHQFEYFLNNAFQAFPSFQEYVPSEFYTTFAKHLEHVPFAVEFLQQCVDFLKQLVPHFH